MSASEDHWNPTAAFLAGDYQPIGEYCPRCGVHTPSSTNDAQVNCAKCGATWQRDAPERVPGPPEEDALLGWVRELSADRRRYPHDGS